jgi:hypothetical protein
MGCNTGEPFFVLGRELHYMAFGRFFFSVAGRFHFTLILELSILGTPDFRNCKSLPLKAGFGYTQIYFKTGFAVFFRVQRKGYIWTYALKMERLNCDRLQN